VVRIRSLQCVSTGTAVRITLAPGRKWLARATVAGRSDRSVAESCRVRDALVRNALRNVAGPISPFYALCTLTLGYMSQLTGT
jgi:hypothetical protein